MSAWRRIILALAIVALAGAVSCGQGTLGSRSPAQPSPVHANVNLPLAWPPEEQPARVASDDEIVVHGIQFDSSGGNTSAAGKALKLGPDIGDLCYSLYSLGGFGTDVQLDTLTLQCLVTPGSLNDGTTLYIALSNYAKGYWEWYIATPNAMTFDLPDFTDYFSPAGTIHIAAALGGGGTARVDRFTFARTGSGAFVPQPQNLTGQAVPGFVQLDWDAVPNVEGYNVYRSGQADFSDGGFKLNPTPVAVNTYQDLSVAGLTQYYYRVTAVRDVESVPSDILPIMSADSTEPPPQNLVADADVGSVGLTWDAVLGAASYHVYRATQSDLGDKTQVGVSATPSYTDHPSPYGKIYYYYVTAQGIEESLPSNVADVFAPQADLPAPTNFRIIPAESHGDFVTFAWDWSGADPSGFRIYIHTQQNFALDGGLRLPVTTAAGAKRKVTEYTLTPPHTTFYARICAYDASNNNGRMSDDISFTNGTYWTWSGAENVGINLSSAYAVGTDGTDLTVAYYSGGQVLVAHRDAGTWTPGEGVGLNDTFSDFVDIAYGNGKFLIGSMDVEPGDAWVSVGNPGGPWTATRIDGDGSTAPGHTVSGVGIKVAANDSEYSVIHVQDGDPALVFLQTRAASGGAWTNSTIYNLAFVLMESSLSYSGSDLNILVNDFSAKDLEYGDSAGGFTWQAINQTPGDEITNYSDILPFGAGLLTPAYDSNNQVMYAYEGSGASWNRTQVVSGRGSLGLVDMIVFNGTAMVAFIGNSSPSRWYIATYDGTDWDYSTLLKFPVSDVGGQVKLCAVDDQPYIVYTDNSGNNALKCAMGNPPG